MSHNTRRSQRNNYSAGSDSPFDETSSYESQEDWAGNYKDVEPSDSASASGEYDDHERYRKGYPATRRPPRALHQPGYPYGAAPPQQSSMSTDPSEEQYYSGRGYQPTANPHYYHAQSHVGYNPNQYGAASAAPTGGGRGQMVHYQSNGYPSNSNPFQPMGNGQGANYYGEPRQSYEMVANHVVPYQNNYFGGAPQYAHGPMQPYMYNPPPPPPTEAPAPPQTPAPPPEKKIDPEVELMRQKLELLETEKRLQREAEERKALQETMQKAAEMELQRRLELERRAKEEQDKELAKAKLEAERAARERIEAERKAKEEEARQQKLAIERIEAETRLKWEKEQLELVEKRQRQEEIDKAAAEALKAKVEAAEAAARAKAAAEFKAEIEAKEAAEKKAKEEKEWRKRLEEEAKLKAEVEARAKLEEERKKAEEAKAAEEEKKKADKAMRDKIVEETKAKIQDDAKKNEKPPIRFKDAVGRKFSFPFHLCQTWTGMEELIKQAFVQVEAIGPHVQEGHYDLVGPNGEIILPSIWEKVVQPDWAITMHMWPMDKSPPLRNAQNNMHPGMMPPGARHPMQGAMPGRGMPMPGRGMPMPAGAPHPHWQQMPGPGPGPGVRPGSAGPRMGMGMNMGPGMGGRMAGVGGMGGMGHAPGAHVVDGDHPRHSSHDKKKGSSSKSAGTTFLNFMGGKPAKSKKRR